MSDRSPSSSRCIGIPCVVSGGVAAAAASPWRGRGRGGDARGQRPTQRRGVVARFRTSLISSDANSTRCRLDGRGVAGDLQREQALAHRRAGGDHVQPAVLQPAEQPVQLRDAGREPGDPAVGRGRPVRDGRARR